MEMGFGKCSKVVLKKVWWDLQRVVALRAFLTLVEGDTDVSVS